MPLLSLLSLVIVLNVVSMKPSLEDEQAWMRTTKASLQVRMMRRLESMEARPEGQKVKGTARMSRDAASLTSQPTDHLRTQCCCCRDEKQQRRPLVHDNFVAVEEHDDEEAEGGSRRLGRVVVVVLRLAKTWKRRTGKELRTILKTRPSTAKKSKKLNED